MEAPRKPVLALLAVLLTALCVTLSVPAAAFAEGGGDIASKPPVHTKTITPNNDGTYDLSLTVTGDTELSETKTSANVIVVQDVSGSMDNDVYTYSLEKTEKYDRDGTYGMVDGEPVKLERNWGFFGLGAYNYYLDANGKEVKYTGDLYHKVGRETGKTRLDVAKEALNSLADQLIASNDSTVKLSLETFSDRGNTPSQYYAGGQASDFKDAVNGLRADGGTNWVDALTKANAKANEDPNTPTYIIFLSDGEPTYGRDRWGTTGNGTTYRDDYFNNAVDEANKRPSNVAGLFTVYTGSEASEKMNSFAQKTTGGSAFDGTDSEKLNAAFANIIQTITKSAGYKDVKIVDKLSEYVTGTSANGAIDPASVSYQKNGETWAEAPAAVIGEDGTLSWDLKSVGELEKGATYKVTFKVKPSQAAYDKAVENGKETSLPSNDGDATNVFYKTVLKETGKDDQVSDEKSDGFEVPTFSVPVDTVTVKKEWANTNGAELPGSVTVQLQKDGQDYGDPFQLTAVDGWTKEIIVPAGVGQISWSVVETAVDGYDTSYSEAVTGTGVLTVTNTHKTWPGTLSGAANLTVTKNLTGRDWADGDSFKFKLEQTAGDASAVTMPDSTELTIDSKTADHKAAFGDITFSAAGEYEFTIAEEKGGAAGVTYDETKNVVKVSVRDEGGKLVAAVTDGANPTFTNTYAAKSVTVAGAKSFAFQKVLTGRDLRADEFSFTISSKDEGAPLPEHATVSNAVDGSVKFGDITFAKVGVYHYNISEDTSKLPGGVTATTQGAKQVTVTVTDNGKGQLEAKVDTPKDVIFKNAYKPADTTIEKLMTTKVVKASQNGVIAPQLKGGDFRFTISSTNNGPLPEQTTVTNDAAGNIAFGAIKFTKPGEYHYTITESGSMAGVTNDSEPKNFTVTVKDNDDGTMTATASKIDGFVNTYAVQPTDYSVTPDVSIAKKLEGRALKAGEFTFQLIEGNKVVSEGTNDADGNVTFKSVNYTSADLGEHTYKVREVEGNAGGVIYDKSEYDVKVNVTDNGDGTLSAKASSDGAIKFKNSYAADPTSVSFSATKVLDGAELKDGQFSFVLKDDEGNKLQTAKNAADGTVSFQPVEFTRPGTHTFTIAEVNDGQANVAYDDASYQLTVNVTDDGEGHLSASVDGQAPVFKNTYTAPAQPKDDQKPAQKAQKKSIVPKTGDSTNIVAPVVIIVVAAACIVLGFLAKNKKK